MLIFICIFLSVDTILLSLLLWFNFKNHHLIIHDINFLNKNIEKNTQRLDNIISYINVKDKHVKNISG